MKQLKRKKITLANINENPQAEFILKQIDNAVDSLSLNEDEVCSVLNELLSRKLSEEEKEALRSSFDSYFRSTKYVRKITGN